MNSCMLECARCQLCPASQFSWIPAKYASISFLCSNAGGEQINEMTLDLWRAHKDREEISLQDLELAISKAVFENPQSESMSPFCRVGGWQRQPGLFQAATDIACHLPGSQKGTRGIQGQETLIPSRFPGEGKE